MTKLFKRLAAFFIDWYLSTLFCMIPVVIFNSYLAKDLILENRIDTLPLNLATISTLISIILFIVYFCIFPLRNKLYQTPGRKLLNLSLTSSNNHPISFYTLLIRDFVGIFLLQGVITTSNIYLMSITQMILQKDVVPYFQGVYYLILLISLFLLLKSKGTISFHDWLSKTQIQ